MFILGLVGKVVREVTGQNQNNQACACGKGQYCAECAYLPAGQPSPMILASYPMSWQEARREYKYERRAMKAARKAARRGYGYTVAVPGRMGSRKGSGCGRDGASEEKGVDYYLPGSSSSKELTPEQRQKQRQEMRLASLDMKQFERDEDEKDDEEDEEDIPPAYERGSWEPESVCEREFKEGLTEEMLALKRPEA